MTVNKDLESATVLAERSQAEAEAVVATFLETPEPFARRSAAKWSPGENVEHLRLAVRPLNLALLLPRFALRAFGRPRQHRPYEQVVEQYRARLARGAKATTPFIPASLAPGTDRERLIRVFRAAYATYVARLGRLDGAFLDSIRLPHPILGRLTMREMAFFTLYHLHHHRQAIRQAAGPA